MVASMKITEYLPQRRKELSISQAELATRLSNLGQETSPARVGHWETGRNNPPLNEPLFRQALSIALETDVNTMMNKLGYVVTTSEISEDARRAAAIVDSLPDDAKGLAIDYLEVLLKRYVTN